MLNEILIWLFHIGKEIAFAIVCWCKSDFFGVKVSIIDAPQSLVLESRPLPGRMVGVPVDVK